MDIYLRYIDPLSEKLKAYIMRRRRDIPEDEAGKMARFLATVFYICEEYGAGDALAGLIAEKNIGIREFEVLRKILEGLGVRNLPEAGRVPGRGACMYVWRVLRESDFGDPEINEIARALDALGRSGGSGSVVKRLEELLGIKGE